MTTKIAYLLTHYNDEGWLEQMIPTLSFTEHPFDLYVISNGSTDRSTEICKRRADHLLEYTERQPVIKIYNETQKFLLEEGYDYIGILHPDMRFPFADWLDKLIEALNAHPSFGQLSPYNEKWAEDTNDPNYADKFPNNFFPGHEAGVLTRPKVLEEVGYYDMIFAPVDLGGYEDWDLHRRMIIAKWEVMIYKDARMWHCNGGTRVPLGRISFEENGVIYEHKWGDRKEVLAQHDL